VCVCVCVCACVRACVRASVRAGADWDQKSAKNGLFFPCRPLWSPAEREESGLMLIQAGKFRV
jgi:hypothetical protein